MPDESPNFRTTATGILAALAIVAALYFGAEFLAPIALAVILAVLFRPIVRGLSRLHLPAPVGATIVVLGLTAALVGAFYLLSVPVRKFAANAPATLAAAQEKLARFRQPVQKVTETARQIQGAVTGSASQPASRPAAPATQPSDAAAPTDAAPSPAPAAPAPAPAAGETSRGVFTGVLGATQKLVAGSTEVFLLLLLILAAGDAFFCKLVGVLPGPHDKRIAEEIVDESEAVVRRYILVTALINAGEGVVIALIMRWLGMPAPLLWGVFTFVFEFVPFLGALALIAMLSVAALATLDGTWRILLAPGSYLLVTTLQNNIVSPVAYGSRLKLNPVAILVGVMFWWYVWGITGAFLAVPILAILKIAADRSERFKPLGVFLGE